MDHWNQVCPQAFTTIHYEELVLDQEGMSRKLLELCGLEWDPIVLEFYKNDREVLSASKDQVKLPIYRSSLNEVEPYKPFLQELIDGLKHV
jgi:hypothetical protein